MSIEAMKLALEALENAWLDASMGKGDVVRHTKAITSLRQAIAKAEQAQPVAHPFEDKSVISALAWASELIRKEYHWGHNGADSWLMNYSDSHGAQIRNADRHRKWEKVNGRWTAKLTTPPQRKPLTDEEAYKALADLVGQSEWREDEDEASALDIFRAAEAAHGITGENT